MQQCLSRLVSLCESAHPLHDAAGEVGVTYATSAGLLSVLESVLRAAGPHGIARLRPVHELLSEVLNNAKAASCVVPKRDCYLFLTLRKMVLLASANISRITHAMLALHGRGGSSMEANASDMHAHLHGLSYSQGGCLSASLTGRGSTGPLLMSARGSAASNAGGGGSGGGDNGAAGLPGGLTPSMLSAVNFSVDGPLAIALLSNMSTGGGGGGGGSFANGGGAERNTLASDMQVALDLLSTGILLITRFIGE